MAPSTLNLQALVNHHYKSHKNIMNETSQERGRRKQSHSNHLGIMNVKSPGFMVLKVGI
jgi:heme exporter protein D